ncbi:hypothetical protein CISIN_1g039679mg, partial [Citrus sinensis]
MWYLCVFFHRLLDYRKPEVESLAYLFGVNDALEWKLPKHHHPDSPFHFVNLPSEDIARSIANRIWITNAYWFAKADNNLPPWRPGLKEVFDAIICDPPYGVRASGRKLLKGVLDPYTVPDDKRVGHIPSTAPYCLSECVHDLLDLAGRILVMGGRLVYFYPVLREDSTRNPFPEHLCFKLVASSEQILSSRYSRVLLTMVKIGLYTEEIAETARRNHLEFRENHLKWLED